MDSRPETLTVTQGATSQGHLFTCRMCRKVFRSKRRNRKCCSHRCAWDLKKITMPKMPIAEKRCSHCKRIRPASDFAICRTTSTGLQSWCNPCLRRRERAVLIEYECEDCHQICKRRDNAPGREKKARRTCARCTRRRTFRAKGGHSHNYTGTENFAGRTICSWKLSARRRGHEWNLSNEQLDHLYEQQGGICALSGLKMGGESKHAHRPSIDRIDSTKGYSGDNVQFVCSVVNMMKNKLPECQFIQLCVLIAAHRA